MAEDGSVSAERQRRRAERLLGAVEEESLQYRVTRAGVEKLVDMIKERVEYDQDDRPTNVARLMQRAYMELPVDYLQRRDHPTIF